MNLIWYDEVLAWFGMERISIHVLYDDKRVFKFPFLWRIT